ncbi:hypothetical protein SEPCBS57363_001696 [Sporothrix epigloea]|uniref:N-acetyltransferase domain-containing protein n=1 Tax=Sporothrix epigloea TaxID=1892477 RepID=A0ABP0DDE7_9PEZI
MATSDAMIDPAITGSSISTTFGSSHYSHNVDCHGDGETTVYNTEDFFETDLSVPFVVQSAPLAPVPAQTYSPSPAPYQSPAPTRQSASTAATAAAAVAAAAAATSAVTPAECIQQYNPTAHGHLVLYLAALHGSRITADNLSGSFVSPLKHDKLLGWWRTRLTTSAVFLLLRSPSDEGAPTIKAEPGAATAQKVQGPDLVGVIMLRSHPAETSPHVATIDLLLVNLQYRQLGGERQLLQTVERQALREGRTLLTAETETNSSMASTYKSLGFTEAGQIPGMILRPATGEKRALSIFYKDLKQAAAQEAAAAAARAQSVASSPRQSPAVQS